ncbi:hypothetical protein BGZ57DRAFT_849031 [Hyaloscypha finlandica]|nr:hypothetical protein BGZ57DRAFT_849031 [Hyaloscypha finlandica]
MIYSLADVGKKKKDKLWNLGNGSEIKCRAHKCIQKLVDNLLYLENGAGPVKVPPASTRSHGECDARIKFPAVSDESGPACDEAYIQKPVILGSRYRSPSQDGTGSWMKDECLGVRLVETLVELNIKQVASHPSKAPFQGPMTKGSFTATGMASPCKPVWAPVDLIAHPPSAISQKPPPASQFDRTKVARVQKGLVSISVASCSGLGPSRFCCRKRTSPQPCTCVCTTQDREGNRTVQAQARRRETIVPIDPRPSTLDPSTHPPIHTSTGHSTGV